MKNANVKNQKSTNVKNVEIVKELNLSKFSDQLSKIELKEKRKKETIYVYPEGFQEKDINSEKGKKFRNSKRNLMKRFCNNILLFAKMQRIDDLKKEIGMFQENYVASYRINDYSLSSISNSKDESKEMELSLMMEIIKDSL